MRWKFDFPEISEERAVRVEKTEKIKALWADFSARANELTSSLRSSGNSDGSNGWDYVAWISNHLNGIDPDFGWEFGPGKEDNFRFTISPESKKHLRPLADYILSHAPAVKGWEFTVYRPPSCSEDVPVLVRGRTGHEMMDFKIKVSRGEYNGVNIEFFSPACKGPDDKLAQHQAIIISDYVLGEEFWYSWRRDVTVAHANLLTWPFQRGLVRLDRLAANVNAVIGSIEDQMPSSPCWKWIVNAQDKIYKLKPRPSDKDYPHQSDVFISFSAYPDMWMNVHKLASFDSRRYSKHGETFCYVKLDEIGGVNAQVAAREVFAVPIAEALMKEHLGCRIGSGTGLRYSYIDLAITDLKKSTDLIRKILYEKQAPKRTWILFYDDTLWHEWIGVYEDTPRPPIGGE